MLTKATALQAQGDGVECNLFLVGQMAQARTFCELRAPIRQAVSAAAVIK